MEQIKQKIVLLAGVGLVLVNRGLLRAGIRKPIDGWRRAAGVVLRGDESTFVLSAFGLNASRLADETIEQTQRKFLNRIEAFLASDEVCRKCVAVGEQVDHVQDAEAPGYTIKCESWRDGPARFVRPDEWFEASSTQTSSNRKPMINIVCRLSEADCADVWMRVNHVAADGVPVQEMLGRLERSFGTIEDVIFPTPKAFEGFSGPRVCAGRAGIAEMQMFLDFTRLLDWRKKQNANLSEPMTVSAAILWQLGQHAAFADLHMGTTVEVAANGHLDRGVGVVVVRPSDYRNRSDGLQRYVRDLNRAVELNRLRKSDGCKTLDAAAFLPPQMAGTLLRTALKGKRAFGAMALTVLRDAKVFGAPIADTGHDDGFIAVGSISLNAGNDRKVGCVTIKGSVDRVQKHMQIVRDTLQSC